MNRSEYQAPIVGQAKCSYTSLNNIYGASSASAGQYTVPKLCPNSASTGASYPPRVDTLTHGQKMPSCTGYFSMKSAYPEATCSSCDIQYVQKPCNASFNCQ